MYRYLLSSMILALWLLSGSAFASSLKPDHASNMCLDFMGGKGHLRKCSSADSQNFALPKSGGSGPLQVAGACVEMAGNGKQLLGVRCRNVLEQVWVFNRQTGALFNPKSRLCADVRGEGRETGAEVIAYRCTRAANQRWKDAPTFVRQERLVTLRPRHADTLCIDVEGGGNRILLWRCNGQGNQKFKLPDGARAGRISDANGKCLNASSADRVSGTTAVVCHHGYSGWIADGTGEIRNTKFGTCLTVPNRSKKVGTVLKLEPCNQGPHQVFVRK